MMVTEEYVFSFKLTKAVLAPASLIFTLSVCVGFFSREALRPSFM